MTEVEFWFDLSCPYAFLASRQIERIAADAGATLRYKPMLLGGVFAATGVGQGPMQSMAPARRAHLAADLARWGRYWGVEIAAPATHPMRTVSALRALMALPSALWPAATKALFEAYWLAHRDLTSPRVIGDVLGQVCGADVASTAVAASETPALKDALRAATAEAVEQGMFGAPAFVVRRPGEAAQLFWGQDRLPHVAAALRGWDGVSAWSAPARASVHLLPRHASRPPIPVAEAPVTLRYYFDFSSPFAYLGATQASRVARELGVTLRWAPMFLGGVFRSIGTVDVPLLAMPEAKRAYLMKEQARWAAWWDVPLAFPALFPVKSTKALRMTLAILEAEPIEQVERWILAVFRAYWQRGANLDLDEILLACLDEVGLARGWLAQASDEGRKQQLVALTEAAVAAGVFGAPTISIEHAEGRELVWGQDRWELVAMLARDAMSPAA